MKPRMYRPERYEIVKPMEDTVKIEKLDVWPKPDYSNDKSAIRASNLEK